jgi:hypothetical protein
MQPTRRARLQRGVSLLVVAGAAAALFALAPSHDYRVATRAALAFLVVAAAAPHALDLAAAPAS